jgi:LPXTG-site transpeptidase (sortase) family protein
LGDFVWDDLNANGIQDAGEAGISGVTVNLLDSTNTTILATATTNGTGYYSFTNLIPGSYYVGFITSSGYHISLYRQGSDATKDSDADTTTGKTVQITLVSNQSDLTWDAGLYQLASIGDLVWEDLNLNGLQDNSESGMVNVTVDLLDGTGATVATTVTDTTGLYSFTNLIPGDYSIRFSPPAGYVFTLKDQGSDNELDSDVDRGTGQTVKTALVSGQTDLTWDAGVYLQVPTIGIAKRVVGKPVKVSAGTWDVTYELLVHNYGNVPLTNLQVTDDLTSTFPAGTTFTVQSVSSTDFTVNWPGFTGLTGNQNLLMGADSLDKSLEGKITLIVRVVPADDGPFNNSAIASGQPLLGTTVTDISQNGTNPDPDNNGDPTNNNVPTPIDFGANLFDPPFGVKVLDQSQKPLFHWTMIWINDTNIVAINTAVSDGIPSGTTFQDNGIPSGSPLPGGPLPVGTVASGVLCTPASIQTTTTYCYYEGPTFTYPRGRIVWQGVLGPDLGIKDPKLAVNDIKIEFNVLLNNGVRQVNNTATIDADLNGNGVTTDTGERQVASASANWNAASEPPVTGFAPGTVTTLPIMPANAYDVSSGLTIEIPALGINTQLIGIPVSGTTWDITWLGKQLGYLDGTAFPTLAGNSVITGHVYGADGLPGPFVNLAKLKWGDQIIINAFGQRYVYEVRTSLITTPNDPSILKHETLPWITLVTCKDYDEKSKTYLSRVVVRAVQVKVGPQ